MVDEYCRKGKGAEQMSEELKAEIQRLTELNAEMEKILRRQCSLCQLRDHEVRCEWCDIEKILNKIKKEENKQ